METLKGILVILGVLIIILCIEKLRHMDEPSTEALTVYAMNDFLEILKGIWKSFLGLLKGIWKFMAHYFTKTKVYHLFEESFEIKLKNTVSNYVATGFEVDCSVEADQDRDYPARFISIRFTANQDYPEKDIADMAALELKQFRQYMAARNFPWKNFVSFIHYNRDINIKLYFAEFPEEEAYLQHRYKVEKADASPNICGVITDDDLDRELEDIDDEG